MIDTRRSGRPAPGALTLLAFGLLCCASGPAAAKKLWSHTPDKGFIDDAMTFHEDQRFAYIHTDSSKFLDIVLLDMATYKPATTIKVADARRVPKALAFTPDGSKLLLLWMDGYSGKHGAMLFDATSGKQLKELKATAQFAAVVSRNGQQLLSLGDSRADKRGNQKLTVNLHRTSDLRKTKTLRLAVAADRTIKRPKMRLLYFEPGHMSLVGQMRGEYDRKRDIRLPERGVRYDLVKRKVVWAEAPKKLVDWTRAINMRPGHSGQLRFLQVSDDLKTLFFVSRDNEVGKVSTPVKWRHYEPKSLKQAETADGKTLYFSMTIDPVNADAVARKKADKERVDLYRLDPGPKATPLGKVRTGKRRFSWVVGTGHFSYLHKLKGFGRGGKTVEIHSIGR